MNQEWVVTLMSLRLKVLHPMVRRTVRGRIDVNRPAQLRLPGLIFFPFLSLALVFSFICLLQFPHFPVFISSLDLFATPHLPTPFFSVFCVLLVWDEACRTGLHPVSGMWYLWLKQGSDIEALSLNTPTEQRQTEAEQLDRLWRILSQTNTITNAQALSHKATQRKEM